MTYKGWYTIKLQQPKQTNKQTNNTLKNDYHGKVLATRTYLYVRVANTLPWHRLYTVCVNANSILI